MTHVWVLIAVGLFHGHMVKEHVAVYGKEDTCQMAREATQWYVQDRVYFCQKELLK